MLKLIIRYVFYDGIDVTSGVEEISVKDRKEGKDKLQEFKDKKTQFKRTVISADIVETTSL